jgi:hypothetical protein
MACPFLFKRIHEVILSLPTHSMHTLQHYRSLRAASKQLPTVMQKGSRALTNFDNRAALLALLPALLGLAPAQQQC